MDVQKTEDGFVELNIPVAIVGNCTTLSPGQKVQLSGTSQKQHPEKAPEKDITLFAERRGEWLSFSLQTKLTGGLLQDKLDEVWKCDIVAIELVETATSLPQETEKRTPGRPPRKSLRKSPRKRAGTRKSTQKENDVSDTEDTTGAKLRKIKLEPTEKRIDTVEASEEQAGRPEDVSTDNVEAATEGQDSQEIGVIVKSEVTGVQEGGSAGEQDVEENHQPNDFDVAEDDDDGDENTGPEIVIDHSQLVSVLGESQEPDGDNSQVETEVKDGGTDAPMEDPAPGTSGKQQQPQLQSRRRKKYDRSKYKEGPRKARHKTTESLEDVACKHCNRTWFVSFKSYHRHINNCAQDPANRTREETEEEKEIRLKFTCKICNMACGKDRLKRHLEIAHQILVSKHNPRKTNSDKRCEFCGITFASLTTLSRHRRFKCLKNPNARIGMQKRCKYCGSSFDVKDLQGHIRRIHPNGFKQICDICGKVFTSRLGMYCHRRTHFEASYKYRCNTCNKTFVQRGRYEEHLTVHSDVRDTMCSLCGKKFKGKKALRQHHYTVHKNRYKYHCDKCGHGMSKLQYLESHKCDRVRRKQGSHDTTMAKPHVDFDTQSIGVRDLYAADPSLNQIPTGDTMYYWAHEYPEKQHNTDDVIFVAAPSDNLVSPVPGDTEPDMTLSSVGLPNDTSHGDETLYNMALQDSCDNSQQTDAEGSTNPSKATLQCSECGKYFTLRHSLRRHLRTIHFIVNVYKCELCGHDHETNAELRKHIREAHSILYE